jgi:16S rRNA G966 N2-methylase RsmD
MKIEEINIDDVIPYYNNPRKNQAVDKVASSIIEFGFQQPIVVDKNMVVIVGHTRLLASKKLKLEKVPVTIADLDENKAKAYRIADNRLNEDSDWDYGFLKLELELLPEEFLLSTGFNDIELQNILDFNLDEGNKYEDGEKGSMEKNFGVPPFSILDTRQGYWQDRKKYWNNLIGDQGESRENTLAPKGSIMESIGSVSILDAVLAELICRWFGKKDFHVFDCFAGDTVFGFVAGSAGMTFTGIELRKEQAELNNKRVMEAELSAKYICDNGANMDNHINDNSMDLFFSCPPYADLEVYSDDPNDLSNMEHDEFFKVYKKCLKNTYKKLKDNRFAVIVMSEVRGKKGGYLGIIPATIDCMVEAGYQYWNELILVNSAGTLPLRAGKSMHSSRKVGRMHQNVLVFFKGSPNSIKTEFGNVVGGLDMGEEDEQSL